MQKNEYNNKNVECIVYIGDHTFSKTVSRRNGYQTGKYADERLDKFIIYVHEHVAKTKEFDRFVKNRITDLAVTSTPEDVKVLTMESTSYNDVAELILEMKDTCTNVVNTYKKENERFLVKVQIAKGVKKEWRIL